MSTQSHRNEDTAHVIVTNFIERGIRLLAVDFDQTLISVHSGGIWKDGVEKLAELARPCLVTLMKTALEKGLSVCVVTFFMQPWLIREMLKIVLTKRYGSKVIVQANTVELRERSGPLMAVGLGKEAHLASVVNTLYTKQQLTIKPQEILLLDDDEDNILVASQFGHWTLKVTDDISSDSLNQFSHEMLAMPAKQGPYYSLDSTSDSGLKHL